MIRPGNDLSREKLAACLPTPNGVQEWSKLFCFGCSFKPKLRHSNCLIDIT